MNARILCIGVVLVGCSTVTVRVPVMRPAEVNLRGKTELALGDVNGQESAAVAGRLKNAIGNSGRFKLVDRAHMDQVLKELQLSTSDLADVDSRKKLGKLMTAAILITGNVGQANYEETSD